MNLKTRRSRAKVVFGLSFVLPVLALLTAQALGHGSPAVKTVLTKVFSRESENPKAKVTLLELSYGPGESSAPHRHPGPVVVYILEGALEAQIDDGPVRTYKKGESFFEPANALHKVSRNASQTEPVRFLAYMLTSADEEQLVRPAK